VHKQGISAYLTDFKFALQRVEALGMPFLPASSPLSGDF